MEQMAARILWIEGRRANSPSFIPNLRKKGYHIDVVPTGTAALDHLSREVSDLVVLNAASLRSSGKRICRSVNKKVNGIPIVVITSPDQPLKGEMCANEILTLPFTSRKLVNRIEPLLPGAGDKIIKAGAIILDCDRRQVKVGNREERLTPRLVQILEAFLRSPGIVLEREALFREVWNTEYTGDTRTLDVHISWLRQAIEKNPREPEFLKTIRGVGYRLDV
jgi:DNA-binding response OmpR family regulator